MEQPESWKAGKLEVGQGVRGEGLGGRSAKKGPVKLQALL